MIKTPEQKRKDRKALRILVLISQLGICMLVPVFICVFLGQWISQITGQILLFPLMLLIGVLAGFRSAWYMISRFTGLVPPTGAAFRKRTGESGLSGPGEDEDEMDRENPQGQ